MGGLCATLIVLLAAGQAAQTEEAVTGRIQDSLGAGLQAVVTFSGPERHSVSTDSQGRFNIGLQPGRYQVRVDKTGYLTIVLPTVDIGGNPFLPLTITLPPAAVQSGQSAVPPAAGAFSDGPQLQFQLRLRDLSGRPVGGAEVGMRDSADRRGGYRVVGFSDENGVLAFDLPPGPHDLQIVSPAHHLVRIHYISVRRLVVALTPLHGLRKPG